jgi:hypothetical protein
LFTICLGVGQTTFFSSLRISRNHFAKRLLPLTFTFFFLDGVLELAMVGSNLSSAIKDTSFRLLFCFAVDSVFPAEPAIFVNFESIRRLFFVFSSVVVSLLAVVASERDFYSDNGASFYCLPALN